MIRNMSETALKAGLLDINRINGPGLYEIMEKILFAMEEVGMLPPEITIQIADNEYGCIEEGFTTSLANEWEPEDEAK
jgi:hypothetical protein